MRESDGGSTLVQTARFKPRGLLGLLYWAAVTPLHGVVFRGMLRGLQRAAEASVEGGDPAADLPVGPKSHEHSQGGAITP